MDKMAKVANIISIITNVMVIALTIRKIFKNKENA